MSHNDAASCQLHGPFKSCCCNCRFHLRDYHHCTTMEGWLLRSEQYANKCVCAVPKGWVCAGFVMSGESPGAGVHSGWGEHGMCEMHSPISENKQRDGQ